MPTNQRLRANDLNGLQYRRKPAVQLDEKQPVAVRQPNPSLTLAMQHDHLLPERRILRLKRATVVSFGEREIKQMKRDWPDRALLVFVQSSPVRE